MTAFLYAIGGIYLCISCIMGLLAFRLERYKLKGGTKPLTKKSYIFIFCMFFFWPAIVVAVLVLNSEKR